MLIKFLGILLLLPLISCKTANQAAVSTISPPAAPVAISQIPARMIESTNEIPAKQAKEVSVCSFNIQFLGNSEVRKNDFLTSLLTQACDVVFIQELLAAPEDIWGTSRTAGDQQSLFPTFRGALTDVEKKQDLIDGKVESGVVWKSFPNGDAVKFGAKTSPFFEGMRKNGFSFVLSQDKTSRRENHSNGAESEWFIAFFDPKKLEPVYPELTTFIKEGPDALTGGGDFIRVPHAFAFRTLDKNLDFVAVSVHLHFTFKPDVRAVIEASYDAAKKLNKINADLLAGNITSSDADSKMRENVAEYDRAVADNHPTADEREIKPENEEKYKHLFDAGEKHTVPELDARQRAHELRLIRDWIDKKAAETAATAHERDFMILGDMNIDKPADLERMMTGLGMRSFNEQCLYTNSSYEPGNKSTQSCYDQILFNELYLKEADLAAGFRVFDISKIVSTPKDEHGRIADETKFRSEYSDHFPVMIKLKIPDQDDD